MTRTPGQAKRRCAAIPRAEAATRLLPMLWDVKALPEAIASTGRVTCFPAPARPSRIATASCSSPSPICAGPTTDTKIARR